MMRNNLIINANDNKKDHNNDNNSSNKTTAFRVISSESDFIPSLIVENINDALVIQTLSQSTNDKLFKKMIVQILKDQLKVI